MTAWIIRTPIAVYRNLDLWIGKLPNLDLSTDRLWRMVLILPEGVIFVSTSNRRGSEIQEIVARFAQNEREAIGGVAR